MQTQSSRIFVKNLHDKVTEDDIRSHFKDAGTLTDVRLLYRKDGGFRRLAVIGFESGTQADAVIPKYDRSYIRTSKISVAKYVIPGEADSKPRPWSKYSEGSSAYERKIRTLKAREGERADKKKKIEEEEQEHKANKRKLLLDRMLGDVKDDENFKKFVKEYSSSFNGDDIGADHNTDDLTSVLTEGSGGETLAGKSANKTKKKKKKKKKKQSIVAKDSHIYKMKMRGVPYKANEKQIKRFFDPVVPVQIRLLRKQGKGNNGLAFAWFKSSGDFKKALAKNKSQIGKRYVELFPQVSTKISKKVEENEQFEEADQQGTVAEKQDASDDSVPADLFEHRTLIIKNLWYGCKDEAVREWLQPFGPIVDISLPTVTSGAIRGHAFVTFENASDTLLAMNKLNKTIFQGRFIKIEPSTSTADESEDRLSSWNALFVNHNLVAASLAEKFGLSVHDVYSGGSIPAKLAIAEAKIVDETRKFLQDNGVCLDCFGRGNTQRSRTTVIVKNVPKDSLDNVKLKMIDFGAIAKFIAPENGAAVLVEFKEAESVHRLLNGAESLEPMLFERAPVGVFSKQIESNQVDNTGPDRSESHQNTDERCLFVKNLNFATDENSLKKHFIDKLGISDCEATVAKRTDSNNPKSTLSMGYGFVRFKDRKVTMKALKTMQGSLLDEHKLELQAAAKRKAKDDGSKRKDQSESDYGSTKICVKNIPFQVPEKEIRRLFSAFGDLRSIRLPAKPTGGHRGFCFVDFVAREKAKAAFDALCHSTHLFGRRLVLEWANPDAISVETLRKKTARYFDVVPINEHKSGFLKELKSKTEAEKSEKSES